ncbi:MAG: CocE/NonD family hydrolase [Methyloligellaceae bacterium]
MSDSADGSPAWTCDPRRYLLSRPETHRVPAPHSRYLEMPDGIRLAADIYVPEGDRPKGGFPALLHLTPYYRRFALKPGAPPQTEACPNAARFRDMFVSRGYAMVVVDVRGTGASFGSRDSFRSPAEREDFRAVMDWVAGQDWCNGRLGATGISYVGAAADFAATTGHEALKAIAPISAVWDTWFDHLYPGGLLLTNLASSYDALMRALDLDLRDKVAGYAYFADPAFAGPAPVDADEDGTMLRAAIREHAANVSLADFIREFPHRDSALAYDPGFTPDCFSPHAYGAGVKSDLAVLSISGWMDGGYMNGAIARFLTLGGARARLLIGPWDHGARTNVSPFRRRVEPEFELLAEILRFFDTHVGEQDTGLGEEARVHYFTIASEEWKAAQDWPPAPQRTCRFHLAPEGRLQDTPGGAEATLRYTPDFGFGTGTGTRYGRLAALDIRDYYADWGERSADLLRFAGAPLDEAVTLTGHPVLRLSLASTEKDAAVIAYLEDIAPDGTRRYVTEGMLRALHRKESPPPATYRAAWPFHGCRQADAAPLQPGVPVTLTLALLPVSWRFGKGHRIALALAGADADNYIRLPYGRPGTWTLMLGAASGSCLELPLEA